MSKITKKELKDIRQQAVISLQEALGDGYFVESGNGHYGDRADFKLTVTKAGDDGTVKSAMQIDFERNAFAYGLEASDFGASFRANQTWYKIAGLKTRNRKYPIIATHYITGNAFKHSEQSVVAAKTLGDGWWEPADAV
jgi:hypothetical protein